MDNVPNTSRSVHLSASAGSGKTRELKNRYLALLDLLDRNGLSLDQTVAITFTDKAAAEIKERVMRSLPEGMLKKIIRGRQDLRISTIHSFCMNLLKRYPLEAGLPPDFGVLDERDKAASVRMAIEDALDEADRSSPDALAPLRGRSTDAILSAIEHLLSVRSRIKRMEIDAGGPEGLLRAIRDGMETDLALTALEELTAGEEWRSRFLEMERILKTQPTQYETCRGAEHLLIADGSAEPSDDLFNIYFKKDGDPAKRTAIAKKDFKGTERGPYEKCYFVMQELLARYRDLSARVSAGSESLCLLRLFFIADRNYERAKQREGLLDFDDLEILAYRMLRSTTSQDILYWLDRKILHFLVDEFQDTSDIQWSVLGKLTEEIFAGEGAVKPMQPTLFVVGDAKQSIYRFREANYLLIDAVRERMETHLLPEAREIRTLDRNYRSAPEVIGTVNQVFSSLWVDRYEPSGAERQGHTGSVQLIELPPSGDGEDTAKEAWVLAREVRAFVEEARTIYVRDGKEWSHRTAIYEDCAVLIHSRTHLKDYEAALRKEGIPFRVVGGIGFYEEDEVQAVLNTLFFLRNNDDRLSLAAALRSSLFGLTEHDLCAVLRGSGNAVDILLRDHPAAGGLFDGWRRYANTEQLGGLVHRIIRDSGAYLRFGRENPQAVFNLDKLLDTAREFDRRGYTTLQDFVEWVKNIRDLEQREATADMNLPGAGGAVRIMTVHKAKGLEFPVVFLPGLNRQPRSLSSGPPVIIESDGALRMAVRNGQNPVYRELWDRERQELLREHQRVLYVAMTRARDHLVMIATRTQGRTPIKPDTWYSFLHSALPLNGEPGNGNERITVSSYPGWRAETLQHGERTGGLRREVSQTFDPAEVRKNLLPVPGPGTLEWKRATDFLSADREWGPEQPVPAAAPAAAVSPLTRGSVLHRCLEEFAKTGSFDAGSAAGEFPDVASIDSETRDRFLADVGSVLRRITENEELAWIFHRQPSSFSELPFLMRRGNDIVSGIIDRVVVHDDGRGYVVDYKAIAVDNEETLEGWIDHYRPQIRIYCEAAKEIFGLASVEGYLLFLDSARLALAARV